jgi:peptidyl-prolyl cis-trans isomerase B (cyclophilin B)
MMKTITSIFLIVLALAASISAFAQSSFNGKPQYEILCKRGDTVMGKITVEMFPAIAPNHVRNWDSLVTIHFYDSIAFHRVIPGFVIQGGDPNSRSGPRDTWGYGDPDQQTVDAEFSSVSHRRGILSAARLGNDINSATSQFFICVAAATNLDHQYSIYGHVTSGMNIADTIVNAPRDGNDNPYDKISMFITRTGTNDSAARAPQLAFPPNDTSLTVSTKATLRWHPVSDAMIYNVQLALDSGFTAIKVDTNIRQTDTSMSVNKLTGGSTYYWRIRTNNGGKISEYSPAWLFHDGPLSTAYDIPVPFHLYNAFPNPSSVGATIRFSIDKASTVKLTVMDILGRNVLSFIDMESMEPGVYETSIRPRDHLRPGFYIYRLESDGRVLENSLIIL